MSKIYVAKMYKNVLPAIVEEFPDTIDGRKYAHDYADIMTKTKGHEYVVLCVDDPCARIEPSPSNIIGYDALTGEVVIV